MRNITEFLDSVGAKPTNKQSEWLMDCWECGDHKLYFNIDKIIGYCVKCDKTRTLFDIARKVANIKLSELQEFIENHKSQELRVGSFKDSMVQGLLGHDLLQADKPLLEMQWPKGYRSLYDGRQSVIGRRAGAYLQGRGFNLGTLFELGFGYCADGFYGGRIIIPTFHNQTLVYWQARDFTGTVPLSKKILNPSLEYVPNGKSQVLFNYDQAKTCECVLVVESWGSALACGISATAVNGKHISDAQLKLLSSMEAKKFIVFFDAGEGTQAAWKSAEALSQIRETSIAMLPYGDPNEVPKHVRNESIRSCQLYSKSSHIKFLLESSQSISS